MKMKLADIGLGFVSLLLFVQILWLAYNFVAIETVHPFLWEQLGSTFVLAVGFVLLWRTTVPQRQPRLLQSFVLLFTVTTELHYRTIPPHCRKST